MSLRNMNRARLVPSLYQTTHHASFVNPNRYGEKSRDQYCLPRESYGSKYEGETLKSSWKETSNMLENSLSSYKAP